MFEQADEQILKFHHSKVLMLQLSCLFETVLNRLSRLVGLDIFIEPDAPDKSLFDFESRHHGHHGSEYFGFGLHLVVSHL